MKKAISLFLVLVMCLSLWACSEDVPNGTTTATENSTETSNTQTEATEDDTEKQAKYDHALAQLEASTTDYTDPSALVKEAYEILSELDGYKDADKYLKQITITQDVCILIEGFQPNAFGEKTRQKKYPRGYDSQSRLSWFYDHEDTIGGEYYLNVYCYDENGRVASIAHRNTKSNETSSVRTFQYNENDIMIAETTQYSDGSQHLTTYEYNTAGQCIKTLLDYGDGSSDVCEYKYDEFGKKTEMRRNNHDADVEWVTKYYHDEDSNVIKIVSAYYDPSSPSIITEYTYNNGRIISEKMYSDSPVINSTEYSYFYGDYYCYTPVA